MDVKKRQSIEQRIVKRLVKAALEAGYTISVNNGGDDDEIRNSTDEQAIVKELFATDSETLLLMKDGKAKFVSLIYGNDGYDVIADYSSSLSSLVEGLNSYIEQIAHSAIYS